MHSCLPSAGQDGGAEAHHRNLLHSFALLANWGVDSALCGDAVLCCSVVPGQVLQIPSLKEEAGKSQDQCLWMSLLPGSSYRNQTDSDSVHSGKALRRIGCRRRPAHPMPVPRVVEAHGVLGATPARYGIIAHPILGRDLESRRRTYYDGRRREVVMLSGKLWLSAGTGGGGAPPGPEPGPERALRRRSGRQRQ